MYVLKEWIAEYFGSLVNKLKQSAAGKGGNPLMASPLQWHGEHQEPLLERVFAGRPLAGPGLAWAAATPDGGGSPFPPGPVVVMTRDGDEPQGGDGAASGAVLGSPSTGPAALRVSPACSPTLIRKWWNTPISSDARSRGRRSAGRYFRVRRAVTGNTDRDNGER